MRYLTDTLLTLLIPLLILVHLFLAPYTKVEESFNIQATHDILTYGIPSPFSEQASLKLREHYDHLTFTGPIPRTFVGPLALAGVSWPFVWYGALKDSSLGGIGEQLIVRAVLGLFNAYCMISFRNGVAKAFGRNAANWYAVSQASQFHMIYYASRTLPNFFAFGLTTLAMRNLLPFAGHSPSSRTSRHRYRSALTLLTVVGIVFRSELALLLFSHTLYLYLLPHIALPLNSLIPAGFLGALIGLILTIPIDTYFWQSAHPLWPELTGFLYNIINNNAQNWGIQPWHFYFSSALPRLLSNPMLQLCLPFAISIPILRRPVLDIFLPNLLFLCIYSFQPHKEWRFIIYVIPPFLAIASAGASWIWTRRAKSFIYRVLSLSLIAASLASFLASAGMLAVSRLNYPGAQALNRLHWLARNDTGVVKVHMDTLACMTGVTRFLERPPPVMAASGETWWIYDKEEDEERLGDVAFWEGVDYAIVERPERVLGKWEVIEVVDGFAGIGILKHDEDMRRDEGDGRIIESFVKIWHNRSWDWEGWKRLVDAVGKVWGNVEDLVRRWVTMGWWVEMKMEPRLRILKKPREQMSLESL